MGSRSKTNEEEIKKFEKKKKKEKIDTFKEKNKIMIQNWKIFNYILLII